jgi:glycerophosphoryl diester phosphodiesterase
MQPGGRLHKNHSMFEKFPKPILLAHRGACVQAPENTLAAFELALAHGADGVELDAKLSRDGEVMVIHDQTVNRTTNGQGKVIEMTAEELQTLDAGSFKGEAFRGEKIPRLSDVFEAIGKKCIINVELTNYTTPGDSLVEKTCQLVKRHGLQDRIIFSSFLGGNLRKARNLLPDVPRGLLALGGWKGAWARSFQFMFGDYRALHPYITDVNPQQVWRVHRLNRRIIVWTANTADEIRRLVSWGVDGIITDDPQSILAALGRQG